MKDLQAIALALQEGDLVLAAIGLGVAFVMTVEARRRDLQQGWPLAGSRSGDGLPGGLVTGKEVEMPKEGTGTDEMKKSPCVCEPIPFNSGGFEWVG